MRVICIDASGNKGMSSRLRESEVYTVIQETITSGVPGFILDEVKAPNIIGDYRASRFIPCSDIDETEFVYEGRIEKHNA